MISCNLPTALYLGFPGASVGKGSACSVGDLNLILELGRSAGRGHGNLLHLPGESTWTEEPGGLQSMGLQRDTHN